MPETAVAMPPSSPVSDAQSVWQWLAEAETSPICAFDHACRLTAFNQAHSDEFFRIYHHRVAVGEVFPDLFLPDQAPVIRGFMERALAGEIFQVVEEFGDPDLTKPFWAISYTPLRDASGTIVGAFHRAVDISARLRAEAELSRVQQVEERAQVVSRMLVAALVRLDDSLRDIREPDEIARIAAETVGQTLKVAIAGFGTMRDDGETMDIDRDWHVPGAHSVVGVHRLRDYGVHLDDLRQGRDVAVEDVDVDPRTAAAASAWHALGVRAVVNMPVLESGNYVAMMFVLSSEPRSWSRIELDFVGNVARHTRLNIERRRAEAKLRALASSLKREVEARTHELDQVWELSQDPLLIADEQGQWIRLSPAWCRLLGWTEDEMLGRTSEWMEHPDDRGRMRRQLDALGEGVSTFRFENRLRDHAGEYRWFAWSAAVQQGLLYCVARDISDEKRQANRQVLLEEALRQAQKMEAVGQLTGGIAHDFNNLLTGIGGSLEMLQRRVAQGKIADIDRYVAAAQGAARRAAALTHRLLAFSRRQTLDPKPTDVNRLVADMEDMVRRTVGPQIRIDVVGAIGLWPTLVDRNQLENALLNLCINARDAMPEGGRITIETANRWLDDGAAAEHDLAPGQYVSLRVTDTGAGMTPEVIARAFDPFFTTKPLGEGTGLGLSMIYGFVRQSGGQVRIESKVGAGTTMDLFFPRDRATMNEVPSSPIAIGPDPDGAGDVVLVIDDEPTVRLLVREVLDEFGYVALEAADGPSGLKVLQAQARIDLLITDVGLPGGMNGRQVADAARTLRPDLKVLFITGYAEKAAVDGGQLEAGMQVLTKPFTLEALTQRIRVMTEA